MPKIPDSDQLKKALIKLIEKLEGLPEKRRKLLLKSLSSKETHIPKNDAAREVSTFITLVFCTGSIPHLNNTNKKLLEKFSQDNLIATQNSDTPSHSRKKQ